MRQKIKVYRNIIDGRWDWRVVDGDTVLAYGNVPSDTAAEAKAKARKLFAILRYAKAEEVES